MIFSLVKISFCIPPGTAIDIVMDWLLQHPTDEYTHAPKSAGNTFIHACVFFCPIYAYIRRSTLSSSLPFVTHIRGHMVRTSLPSSLLVPCVPSFTREKKKCSELSFLP